MDGIREYVRNIGYYIVFISVVKMIMPKGKIKEYADMVAGLIFMVILLNPLSGLINTELPKLEDYIIQSGGRLERSVTQNDEYKKNEDLIEREYKNLREERIREICHMYFENAEVYVEFNFESEIKRILIKGKSTERSEEGLTIIEKVFGLNREQIILKEEGG